jgi:hypothetical protein
MPGNSLAPVEVTMESLPVQIEWTVVPTTITDEYEVKLNLEFGANIPTPSFGFVPPWVNIPKEVQSTMIIEAQIINTGLIALTDVTAQLCGKILRIPASALLAAGISVKYLPTATFVCNWKCRRDSICCLIRICLISSS